MEQYRPICVVLSLALLGFGSYMLYDASANPLPGATVGLLSGAVIVSLGVFMAFFCWRRTGHEREMSAAGAGAGGPRSAWRFRQGARRGRAH